MKKAVVVGAFSFIGFSLCNKLLNEDVLVYAVDVEDFPLLHKLKFNEIGRNANFVVVHSVDDLLEMDDKNVDVLYYCRENGLVDTRLNEIESCFHFSKKNGAPFIYASSLEVMKGNKKDLDEKLSASPISPHGVMITDEEVFVKNQANHFGVDVSIIRLPTLYGPWQPNTFCYQQLLLGKKDVEADSFTEDILFIDDAAAGLFNTFRLKEFNETFHLGSGKKNEWIKGVEIINESMKGKFNEHEHMVKIKKANDRLNFSPQTSLEIGIHKQKDHLNYLSKLKQSPHWDL